MQLNLNILVGAVFLTIFIFLLWLSFIRPKNKQIVKVPGANLTCEELEEHARKIAVDHSISKKQRLNNWPISRMNDNYTFISSVYKLLNEDVQKKLGIPPAAEWLLDNFYIIEEQVKSMRRDFIKEDYLRLPALKCGHLKGHARVYAITMELVAHTDGQIDERILLNYLKAYQSHTILSDREIWAMPALIRLALIEKISVLCEKIRDIQKEWHLADDLVDSLLKTEGSSADKFYKSLDNMLKSSSDVNSSFIEHLSYRLRRAGRGYSKILSHLDDTIVRYGVSINGLTQKEHNIQAANAVSIGNAIISLKFISTLDWTDIFEDTSLSEQILREDPDKIYSKMDLSSRNMYRRKIEELATTYNVSELHIAKEAIQLAQNFSCNQQEVLDPLHGYKSHVGYYLIGDGLEELDNKLGVQSSVMKGLLTIFRSRASLLYLSIIGIITLLMVGFFIHFTYSVAKDYKVILSILTGVVVIIPSSEITITLVNWVSCNIFKPAVFPRLELRDGIPEIYTSMVVIPALLPDEKRVLELLENLETHYLANKEDNLFFALAGDFKDAPSEHMPGDEKIIATALKGIKELNKKYSKDGFDIFYYFHRHRKFNEQQNKWMGWERKRGALVEFNDLLLGSKTTSYSIQSSSQPLPPIKYVITLDADTILPIDGARKMIGTMAHPLNRPVIDAKKRIVTKGYGLIQPRIAFDIESANKSLFSRIFTGQEGIDPYASAISDVYQDIFGEGIFTGKGIYDLEIFQQILGDTIPENTVLSHDLLEGSFIRTGLVTDLELIDSYPSSYSSYAARMHRWVRGDWQLFPWLKSHIATKDGRKVKNPLSLLSRWKITDNLRRSLIPLTLILMLALGFSILPGYGYFWFTFVLVIIAFPFITGVIDYLLSFRFKSHKVKRHAPVISGIKASFFQTLLQFLFLPYQVYLMVHAIAVTLTRVLFTKKNMLEWVTAADVEKGQKNSLKSFSYKMQPGIVIAFLIPMLSFLFKGESLFLSIPLFVFWVLSPYVAYYISRTKIDTPVVLSAEDIKELKIISRKTWRYFDEFINYKNNFLPPDNYQEDPSNGIAYRTSPTNIGLGLMSFLTARDLGYIGTSEMVQRISKTLSTMEKLEKWNGHLYNWYDTRNLRPLRPRYISTVDNGNMVCYLITLVQGLMEYLNKPLFEKRIAEGVKITADLSKGESGYNYPSLKSLDGLEEHNPQAILHWNQFLNDITMEFKGLNIKKLPWTNKFYTTIQSLKEELYSFMPWIEVLGKMPESFSDGFLSPATTLHASWNDEENKNILFRDLSEDHQETHKWKGFNPSDTQKLGDTQYYTDKDIVKLIQDIISPLTNSILLKDLPLKYQQVLEEMDSLILTFKGNIRPALKWIVELRDNIKKSLEYIDKFLGNYHELMNRIKAIIDMTEFLPLYDTKKQLFSIGYNIEENRLTNSFYDLLASEARQTSYIAIARGEVPPKHWFKLGRALTVVDFYKGLVSWSGTMFEYLMPLILMKNYKNTLLDETYDFVIKSQKKYGRQRRVPWGVSESGFYSLDINLDYQYKAIGVPWLGLKRGLIEDVVVAPYSSFLALPIDPEGAMDNIRRMQKEGLDGPYGFYEAIDYTPERMPFGLKKAIVKSYMVHHEGMSLLSLNNYLNDNILQKRFHNDPLIKAAQLLLQEKIPTNLVLTKENKEKIVPFKDVVYKEKGALRKFNAPDATLPKAHILSNGSYSVMITDRGTGYSRNNLTAVTRWREDVTLDQYGMFFYIRHIDANKIWSSTYGPFNTTPEKYEVQFTSDKARFKRKDGDIETDTEIIVTSGNNAEIRRITLKNRGENPCTLEVTSYFEVTLAPQGADIAHPAFSNLFVKTEYLPEYHCLMANRRPRSENDRNYWLTHMSIIEGDSIGDIEYETDRMSFLGRGHTVSNPISIAPNMPLSKTVGPVLDPMMSLRVRVKVEPGKTMRLSYLVAVTESRDSALELIEKYSTQESIESAFKMAFTRSQVEARYLNIKAQDMELYQDMIPHILFNSPLRRLNSEWISQNTKGQSSLWAYGISGDIPIVLVMLGKTDEIDIVYEALKAHEYWKLKNLKVDLVILNEEENSYTHPLRTILADIVSSSHAHDIVNKPGGVFILNQNNMSQEDIVLLHSVARVILKGNSGSLSKQVKALPHYQLPKAKETKNQKSVAGTQISFDRDISKLQFYNGLGGFSSDGKEYIIRLCKGQNTPLPWINVISNPRFGFIVSESGSGYTWYENSRENKITPWSNDPVSDISGEAFYLSDESGDIWSPTPLPIRDDSTYIVTHGFGYSKFEHSSHGIIEEMLQFVPIHDPIKISIIKLKNTTNESRSLSVTYYIRPVLGVTDQFTAMHVRTQLNDKGTLIIDNPYNEEFSGKIAFMDVSENDRTVTGDRKEFFGSGKNNSPEGLKRESLSGAVGTGFDPCAAMQVNIHLSPNEEKEIVFLLGMDRNIDSISEIISKYKNNARGAYEEVKTFWHQRLGSIWVETPDASMNLMLNGWLLYQVISCRLWARSAFYQSGGAYGFRDQLQDCLSFISTWPEAARKQILLHGKHQFVEGDVQHWWHEPSSKGTRTKFSDDLLWLPFVTAEYVRVSGDDAILQSKLPYLEDEVLKEFEDERYSIPHGSDTEGTLYDHCIRAIDKSLHFGEHNIPLMGSGDWNDGMNTVANKGKGESVWLGWFLYSTLMKMIPICTKVGDTERIEKYSSAAQSIIKAIEENAWDGSWYRRAYFDNGLPLGSIQNSECKIDSISQTWAVISEGGSEERIKVAMNSLENYLVLKDEGLIKLLTPPFDEGDLEPGYIKGYLPGVRENGGQYTHAAAWVIIAYAKLGEGEKAREFFELVNPINHTLTHIDLWKYKAEPYVMAADVYAVPPHVGRGGWTWYTGSASWIYRAGLEYILGFQKNSDTLIINPCIPKEWSHYTIKYRYKETDYEITVKNPEGVNQGVKVVKIDGNVNLDNTIRLVNDKVVHQVEVIME